MRIKRCRDISSQFRNTLNKIQCNVSDILFPSSAIGRTLIPRYFSTVFEGGVSDLYYILKHSKESFHNSCITVDCDQCTMVTQHGKPMFTKVKKESVCVLHHVLNRHNVLKLMNKWWGADTLSFYVCQQNMCSLFFLLIFARYRNLRMEGEMTQLSVSFSSCIRCDKPRTLFNRTNKHGRRDHLLL